MRKAQSRRGHGTLAGDEVPGIGEAQLPRPDGTPERPEPDRLPASLAGLNGADGVVQGLRPWLGVRREQKLLRLTQIKSE